MLDFNLDRTLENFNRISKIQKHKKTVMQKDASKSPIWSQNVKNNLSKDPKLTRTKLFSPINENLKLQSLASDKVQFQKTIDNINFIESNANLDIPIKDVGKWPFPPSSFITSYCNSVF